MVSAGKILTIQFDGFSYVIEGFDDPFCAMNAVAEFLRDMAEDDQGSDAGLNTAMLAQIVRRETDCQIEIVADGDRIILRSLEQPVENDDKEIAPDSGDLTDHSEDEMQDDTLAESADDVTTERAPGKSRGMKSVADKIQSALSHSTVFSKNQDTDEEAFENEDEEDVAAFVHNTVSDESTDQEDAPELAAYTSSDEDVDADDDFEDVSQDETIAATLDDGSLATNVPEVADKTTPPPEDEVDLVAKPADVEHEMDPHTDRGIGMTLRADRANRTLRKDSGGQDEVAVSRLMNKADSQLENDEGSRRRSAISHLRAAVASTIADRELNSGPDVKTTDKAEPYRIDLADVVRDNTAESHPAPLVLVSANRVPDTTPEVEADTMAEVEVDVAPEIEADTVAEMEETFATELSEEIAKASEEVAKAKESPMFDSAVDDSDELQEDDLPEASKKPEDDDETVSFDDSNFDNFVNRNGVLGLADLVEAAAAYITFGEGHQHFGQPEILQLVSNYADEEYFDREAGVRIFDQLVEDGKIVKGALDQFSIAASTRFKPETEDE